MLKINFCFFTIQQWSPLFHIQQWSPLFQETVDKWSSSRKRKGRKRLQTHLLYCIQSWKWQEIRLLVLATINEAKDLHFRPNHLGKMLERLNLIRSDSIWNWQSKPIQNAANCRVHKNQTLEKRWFPVKLLDHPPDNSIFAHWDQFRFEPNKSFRMAKDEQVVGGK